MRVKQAVQCLLLLRSEFPRRQGLEKPRSDRDHSAQCTELALGAGRVIRHDLGDRAVATRQPDLFSCLDTCDELRERGLGNVDGDCFHVGLLSGNWLKLYATSG